MMLAGFLMSMPAHCHKSVQAALQIGRGENLDDRVIDAPCLPTVVPSDRYNRQWSTIPPITVDSHLILHENWGNRDQSADSNSELFLLLMVSILDLRWVCGGLWRVTAHLTFLDPKPENHGNYRVIRNQEYNTNTSMNAGTLEQFLSYSQRTDNYLRCLSMYETFQHAVGLGCCVLHTERNESYWFGFLSCYSAEHLYYCRVQNNRPRL